MDKWIKCSERLPELNTNVLVFNRWPRAPFICVAVRRADDEFMWDYPSEPFYMEPDNGIDLEHVTHWMPLPEFP